MEALKSKTRLEYEAPTAEIVRLGTEDILISSSNEDDSLIW